MTNKSILKLIKSPLWVLLIFLGFIGMAWVFNYFTYGFGKLTIYYLDVGQGDSALLITPSRKVILFDTGPDVKVAEHESQVESVLEFIGFNRIDLLVLSHLQEDHAGGAPALLKKLPIGSIVMPKCSDNPELMQKIDDELAKKRNIIRYDSNNELALTLKDDVKIEFLWPTPEYATPDNDISSVARVQYKSITAIFQGDAGEFAEKRILSMYPNLSVNALKVGHHGSKTASSQEWLNQLQPKLAVISVSENNSYGQPHSDVLQRLNSAKIKVARTDNDGTVIIRTDGKKYGWGLWKSGSR